MRHTLFLCLAGLILLFGECRNDIDITGDYKHVLVCYSLLNPYDTVQYIRVSKGFLGDANALEMAQQADTIGFPIGTLDVKVEHWNNGQVLQVFTLSPDTSIPRDDGIFLSPYQVLYRGTFPVLKDGSIYKLIVTDLARGTTVSSQTVIPQDIVMVDPPGTSSPLNFEDTTSIRVRFKSGTYAVRYDYIIRFHYTEQFISDTTQVAEKYVDWHLGEVTTTNALGNELLQFAFPRHNFLNMLAVNLDYNSNVRRISGKLDFIFTGAAQELVTYIDVTNANNSTSADIPPFSNITDGYGLFSARTTSYHPGYFLDSDTRYALRNDALTQQLNFIR